MVRTLLITDHECSEEDNFIEWLSTFLLAHAVWSQGAGHRARDPAHWAVMLIGCYFQKRNIQYSIRKNPISWWRQQRILWVVLAAVERVDEFGDYRPVVPGRTDCQSLPGFPL